PVTGSTSRVRSNTTTISGSPPSGLGLPALPSARNSMRSAVACGNCRRKSEFLIRIKHPLFTVLAASTPGLVFAQASPFLTGVTSLQENILEWLTPVAIILVMVLGGMAMANRISWGWCIGAIFGIAIAFGAPQIVAWVRGMFGV